VRERVNPKENGLFEARMQKWPREYCVLAVSFLQLMRMHFCTVGHVHRELRARICKRLRSSGIDSEEPIPPAYEVWRARARICKRLRSSGIDSKEPIPSGCVA
jgi:hypothetical protein